MHLRTIRRASQQKTARIPRSKSEEDITNCEWSWIEVLEVKDESGNLLSSKYIQPDNDNTNDHSVLEVKLEKPCNALWDL
jgi:hypothetical protein